MTETPTQPTDIHAADGQQNVSPRYGHLPLRELGLLQCPAIPYVAGPDGTPDITHIGEVLDSLDKRGKQARILAAYGDLLTTEYTIANLKHSAYEFLYPPLPVPGAPTPPSWTPQMALALDRPGQFTLPWTKEVSATSQDLVEPFSHSLTSPTAATESFWPTIAAFGLSYNLLILKKVDSPGCAALAAAFGDAWSAEDMEALQAAGLLYQIDMRMMALEPATRPYPDGTTEVRFAPGTLTVLKQDPRSKALTPVLIQVSTKDGRTRSYRFGDNAWLYALQAAKASITVYGIWLGHVYHWHIVTAAMQMTMYNHLPSDHRLWTLLKPQSQHVIDFDFVLLTALWDKIAPPTPMDGYMSLLKLLNQFSQSREFFDDDPLTQLKRRGLEEADFTVDKRWDAYPLVGFLLDIWDVTYKYVKAVVERLYPNDDAVANDEGLKNWITASADPLEGNVRGLPEMKTRADLIAVLTSILHRVTAHGVASLNPSVNPVLSFVANFPPCLQSADVPEPTAHVSAEQLLDLLPHTGTLGGMTTFYYTFAYTSTTEPLIPSGGPNDQIDDPLDCYRSGIRDFIDSYVKAWNDALARIRGHDTQVPDYAQGQYQQWPLSIEI